LSGKLPPVLSGVSGEYFVAAELTRRGYIASLTLRNTRGIDLLVSNQDASRSIGIQVKTNQGTQKSWLLNKKAEEYFADNLYYVFVNLNLTEQYGRPEFYVVPSVVVASYVKTSHSDWLGTPGRKGRKHKDNPMRRFEDKAGDYLDRWDLLGI